LIGVPKDGLKGVPYDGLKGVPYDGLEGAPSGLPSALYNFNKGELGAIDGPGRFGPAGPRGGSKSLSESLTGLPSALYNFNKGELGSVIGPGRFGPAGLTGVPENLTGVPYENLTGVPYENLTGVPYENLTGVPYENFSDPQTSQKNKSAAAWEKVEAARLAGNYSTSKYTAGDIGDRSTTCSFVPKYSDALDCMGLPAGGPDTWYSWDDSDSSPTKYLNTTDLTTKCALVSSNYQDAMKCMSLEPDVGNSHNAWISNIQGKTTTASKETVRDDPNDVNPWVGLRRPKYKTRAQPLAEARTIASDIPNEMLDHSGSYDIH
jgi:hypothetical protein